MGRWGGDRHLSIRRCRNWCGRSGWGVVFSLSGTIGKLRRIRQRVNCEYWSIWTYYGERNWLGNRGSRGRGWGVGGRGYVKNVDSLGRGERCGAMDIEEGQKSLFGMLVCPFVEFGQVCIWQIRFKLVSRTTVVKHIMWTTTIGICTWCKATVLCRVAKTPTFLTFTGLPPVNVKKVDMVWHDKILHRYRPYVEGNLGNVNV